jgi:hypothetical protein
MTKGTRSRGWVGVGLAMAVVLATPAAGLAQGGPGFLFKTPKVSFGIRTGYNVARAGSDLFDFTREELTVGRRDFDGAYVGGEIAVRLNDRVDLALGFGHVSSRTASEFRDWVDENDQPIEQVTKFRTTPVTVSAKYYLKDRGRSVGRFAWIPARIAPFVGGGAGIVWYQFEQNGDFVDFETLDVFSDRFSTRNNTGIVHGLAGVDVSLNKTLFLTGEARYSWARGGLSRDFVDFDKLDLAGLQLTVGVSARF